MKTVSEAFDFYEALHIYSNMHLDVLFDRWQAGMTPHESFELAWRFIAPMKNTKLFKCLVAAKLLCLLRGAVLEH